MDFSKEIQDTIMNLFKDEEQKMKQLLIGDYDAIRSLSIDNNIEYKEVIEALEPENEEKKKELLKKAKKRKLYFDMLDEIQMLSVSKSNIQK